MQRVYYNKLVRDHIKKIIEKKGVECEIRAIEDPQEFQQELLKKVREESLALSGARNRTEFLSEYADLMVVLDALTQQLEFTEADIRIAIEENVAAKGLYNDHQFLHWSEDDGYVSNESLQGIKKNE